MLVVVDADQQARMDTEAALVRRFEPDYRVVSAESPSTGLAALELLAHNGEDVALIAADLRLPGMTAWCSGTGPRATPGCQQSVVAGNGSLPHADPLHRVGDVAAGDRARPDRLLGCQRVGYPGGVAVSAGARSAERMDDCSPAASRGLSHRRRAMGATQP